MRMYRTAALEIINRAGNVDDAVGVQFLWGGGISDAHCI